jgi:hypothetical protein
VLERKRGTVGVIWARSRCPARAAPLCHVSDEKWHSGRPWHSGCLPFPSPRRGSSFVSVKPISQGQALRLRGHHP